MASPQHPPAALEFPARHRSRSPAARSPRSLRSGETAAGDGVSAPGPEPQTQPRLERAPRYCEDEVRLGDLALTATRKRHTHDQWAEVAQGDPQKREARVDSMWRLFAVEEERRADDVRPPRGRAWAHWAAERSWARSRPCPHPLRSAPQSTFHPRRQEQFACRFAAAIPLQAAGFVHRAAAQASRWPSSDRPKRRHWCVCRPARVGAPSTDRPRRY